VGEGLGLIVGEGLGEGLSEGVAIGLGEALGIGEGMGLDVGMGLAVSATSTVESLTMTVKRARILCTAPCCLVTTAAILCSPWPRPAESKAKAIPFFPPTRSQGGRRSIRRVTPSILKRTRAIPRSGARKT